jgi:hypothetical protein
VAAGFIPRLETHMHKLIFVAGGLIGLTACPSGVPGLGCDSGDVCDSGDTVAVPEDLLISDIHHECSEADWWYWAWANGWTTDGVLSISQDTDPAWTEQHNIQSRTDLLEDPTECDDGSCDYLELTLDHVNSGGDQVSDQTTLYDCDGGRESTMGWRIDIYDLDDQLADCVVWGTEDAIYNQGSDALDAAGDCANANAW